MISVQLDVFSGRPNPRWTLSPRQSRELVERVQADPRAVLPRDAETVGLGYRGFVVEPLSEGDAWSRAGLPATARIGGTRVSGGETADWLLGTSGHALDVHRVREVLLHVGHGLQLLEQPPTSVREQLLQLRRQPSDGHLRPTRARRRAHVHGDQLPGCGPGSKVGRLEGAVPDREQPERVSGHLAIN